ncbi:amidohydrolase [Chryseobacterium sp. MP_3.2]|uniref:amidohydrolase n=1 Tax=Chryseobacterium sp. MP_3.2 TaxID=3071712 RepID=UPI002E02ACFE|nr:omega-amidase [Chryseobacterium sp. MP_3.2]
MKNLTICGLNLDINWTNKGLNLRKIEEYFDIEKADIFLLPEMFSTGFNMNAKEIADREEETLLWMKDFAKNKGSAVCGSVSIEENNQFFNRFYFVKPDGEYDYYDKRHLFSYSAEDEIYSAGKEKVIVHYKGWNILLQVCYDLRFPVFSRNTGDYDVAFYVANWPEKRIDAWNILLKARAIENQSYVFGLNRIGKDGNEITYPKSSYCFFADGSQVSTEQENWVKAELDCEKLTLFRNQFQFLKDGDSFQIT